MSRLNSFFAFLARLFGLNSPPPAPIDESLQVVSPRVLVINFDPIVDAQGTRLTTKMGWNKVDDLITGFIAEMDEVSDGLVKYQYAKRIDVSWFPLKADGFQYTAASYLAMMQHDNTHHEPDGVDYWKIVNDFHLIDQVMSNQIDEVWLFGGPYFGYWESHMVGKNAIWCNSSSLANSDRCTRRFVIMGFNYQRGVAEMIHDIGHRMESIMAYVYDSFDTLQDAYNSVNPKVQPPVGPDKFMNPQNDFERFMLFEKIAPGRAEVGLVHTPPNADKDFDWQNSNTVSSSCDDWLNYPNLQGTRRMINCNEWGDGADGYAYSKWWFKRVPHVKGSKNGILNNWWKYTMQVDQPFRQGYRKVFSAVGLKITFLVHAIVALVFGIMFYLQPGLWAIVVKWTPFDPHMTRIYGAALLALAVSSWFGYRATRWEEVRIVVQMEIAFTMLSIVGGLWAVLFRGAAPLFTWVAIVIWVAFAAAWIYFYLKQPAQA